MNGSYSIFGGNRLTGTVTPIPNKNSLMGAMPLAVIAPAGFSIRALPNTSDVHGFIEIFDALDVDCAMKDGRCVFDSSRLDTYHVRSARGSTFRGSVSLAGPLLARFGKATLPIPGGCKLGERSISTHINAFRDLGIEAEENGTEISLRRPRNMKTKGTAWLSEASVTTTISLASFAAAVDGDFEINNAACEPHVCDVLSALSRMGARIEGIGSNHLRIRGNSKLGAVEFDASPDFVDVAGYCVAAAVTKGEIHIVNGNANNMMVGIARWLKSFSVDIELVGTDIHVKTDHELEIISERFPKASHDLPKLAVAPWPGMAVDVLPVMVTLATKAKGRILFQNWMYESGFDFIRELVYLGADIYMSDPQKIIVMEPATTYRGGVIGSPGVIQGTKALFLAALADPVETTLHGTNILKRRYPDILETYRLLGARIEDLET